MSVRRTVLLAAALLSAPALTACEDSLFRGEPRLLLDTVRLAAPQVDSSFGSAIDLAAGNLVRFPERLSDAGSWDLALRLEGGSLALRPFVATEGARGAGIDGPLSEAWSQLDRVSLASSSYPADVRPLQEGAVYRARSRPYPGVFGQTCHSYAKLRPLSLDAAAAVATLEVSTNVDCNDPRVSDD